MGSFQKNRVDINILYDEKSQLVAIKIGAFWLKPSLDKVPIA